MSERSPPLPGNNDHSHVPHAATGHPQFPPPVPPPPPVPGNNDHSHVPHAVPGHPQFPPPIPPPPMSQQLVISQPQHPSITSLRTVTYIVQVPRDQIYRVPPPENDYIVKRHLDPSVNKKRPLCCLGITAFIVLFVVVLVVIILVMFAKSDDPKFIVERLFAHKEKRPEYNVTLKARNPNSQVAIVYKHGGSASLHFKQKTIANGKYPSLNQDRGKTEEVAIALHGANIVLPKDIEKSMGIGSSDQNKKGTRVSLSLNMDIPARFRIGTLYSRSKKFHVKCDITVDKLSKGTKVLEQECRTERK